MKDNAKPRLRRVAPKRGKRPKIYMVSDFSWSLSQNTSLIERTGSRYRLYSFLEIYKKGSSDKILKELDAFKELGLHVFLDSGAFTFQGRWKKPVRGKVGKYDLLLNSDQERMEFQDALCTVLL